MGIRKSHDILKAFTKRSSLRSKLRTLGFPVVDEAMVDVLGILVYTNVVFVLLYWDVFQYNSHNDYRIHISAWASKLLIFTGWQVRRPGT